MQRTYPAGVPSWVDLEPADQPAAREFYGELFDWQFLEVGAGDATYVIIQRAGQDVGGFGAPGTGTGTRPAWNTFIAVDDADRTVAAVTAAGGRVTVPPTTAGEAGRFAECQDPDGARFRLWQANRRLGAQLVNSPGAWNFSNLHAVDPTRAFAFYSEVFGWESDGVGLVRRPGYGDHLAATVDPDILQRHRAGGAPPGFADAVAGLVPAESADEFGWKVVLTVDDRDSSAATAERLGGTVLSVEDTDWSRAATIRDPEGAVFTASQFTPPAT